MVARMKLHLEDMGPINEADINIGKITIVGGHNSTGKSTLSKFLYSFLRSNSFTREDIAINYLSKSLMELSRYICFNYPEMDRSINPERRRMRFPFVRFRQTPSLDELIDKYDEIKSAFYGTEVPEDVYSKVTKRFEKFEELLGITVENRIPLYISLIKTLLNSEFSSNEFSSFIKINNYDEKDYFNFIIDFKNYKWDDDEAFKSEGGFMLQDVFYVDSVAVLNIFDMYNYSETMAADHFNFLTKNLREMPKDVSSSIFDNRFYEDIISLNNDIRDIIDGEIVFRKGKFYYESENRGSFDMINTASGIKQIGIIQKLLSNFKLKEECFLIIDQPEVNLHPEWQFKLANILTLISKKLDVSIYINTHSPLFIEAIYTFSKYYDVSHDTTYHLAENSQNKGMFNVKEVSENNLSEIYDELGRPYFDMDVLRLEKEMG